MSINSFNIEQLFKDYNIEYITEGNKHCTKGWIQIHCPFCSGSRNYHFGIPINGTTGSCWRCGKHSIVEGIAKLLKISKGEAYHIIQQYGGRTPRKAIIKPIGTKKFKFPSNTEDLLPQHAKYLISRGFDPETISRKWGVQSLGPVCSLDGIQYNHRILAPIFWDGNVVSFQTRDVTGRSKTKYMACPINRESRHHKHILYGWQEKWTRRGICVEGITDVWRLGSAAFATFGIEFTQEQVREIKKHFDEVFVIFDDEPQAVRQALKMVAELRFRGVRAQHVPIVGDPGGMSQTDADNLVKSLK